VRPRGLSEAVGNTPIPEAWIGRSVELIFVSGSSTEYADGQLEEVNERATANTRRGPSSIRGAP
jgi:hypothetical protein